jgi:drug/metabolite transporter (DMT)-like permease
MALFAGVFALYQIALPVLPRLIVIFFQSAVSFAILLPWLIAKGPRFLASDRSGWLLLRAAAGIGATFCVATALKTASLAETVLLNNTAPLFVPLFALLLLKEPINHRLWPALLIGFVGVLFIIHPTFAHLDQGLLFALASGVFASLVLIFGQKAAQEPLLRTAAYYYGLFAVASLPALFLVSWQTPPLPIALALIGAGVCAVGAIFTLALALRGAPSQEVAPFVYTEVLFALLIDALFFHRFPDLWGWLGIGVVSMGGIWTIWIRAQRNRNF